MEQNNALCEVSGKIPPRVRLTSSSGEALVCTESNSHENHAWLRNLQLPPTVRLITEVLIKRKSPIE